MLHVVDTQPLRDAPTALFNCSGTYTHYTCLLSDRASTLYVIYVKVVMELKGKRGDHITRAEWQESAWSGWIAFYG